MMQEFDYDNLVRFKDFDSGVFKDGTQRFSIVFSNDTVWTPRWKHLVMAFKHALITEKKNAKWFRKGKPKTLLVKPIIETLNSEGYALRQAENFPKIHTDRLLFEFEVTVDVDDTIEFTERTYVEESTHNSAKRQAIEHVQETVLNKLRNTHWSGKLAKIVSVRSRRLRRITDWEKNRIDDEENSF